MFSNEAFAIHTEKRTKKKKNNIILFFLFSVLLMSLDFKASSAGAAILFQIPLLTIYLFSCFLIFFMPQRKKKRFQNLLPLLLVFSFFTMPSLFIGFLNGQSVWALIVNVMPLLIFVTATISTYVLLKTTEDLSALLTNFKITCLLFILLHFGVVALVSKGIDLANTRYAVLSGAVVPASAIIAIGFISRFGAKEIAIGIVNLALIMLSVTRTQIAILFLQISSIFLIAPSLLLRANVSGRVVKVLLIIFCIIVIEILLGSGLTTRWVDRFSTWSETGHDPTTLTRIAEADFMINTMTSSADKLLLGNGLAAPTKLTGPAADLAASIVGYKSVFSTHGYGYGHNNHISLLFIGGLFFGLPLLFLLFLNGVQSFWLIRTIIKRNEQSSDAGYFALWGALIIVGELTSGFLSGTFGDRPSCLWYGIGTGMLYWAKDWFFVKNPPKETKKISLARKKGNQ